MVVDGVGDATVVMWKVLDSGGDGRGCQAVVVKGVRQ